MKTNINWYTRSLLSAVLWLMIEAQMTGCDTKNSDPAPDTSIQDEVLAKLIGKNWMVETVTVDGVDQTKIYAGLAIKFTKTQFTATNGGVIWPSTGTWAFGLSDATSIKRDDGIEMKVDITDRTLKLTLTWTKTTLGGGRSKSVKGVNVFSFTES